MPELDSIRGLAILGVVLYHGFYWPYNGNQFSRLGQTLMLATKPGVFGVSLFFVLSGFLITGILLGIREDASYYRRFYGRRALRILPAYCVLLIVLLAFGAISSAYFGLSLIFLSNMTTLFGVPSGYGPLWSLAVEEHYYIVWPFVAQKLSRRALLLFALGICVLVPILRGVFFHFALEGRVHSLAWVSYTWFVVDGLATGSVLAILLRCGISRKRTQWICGICLSAALLATTAAPMGILDINRILGAAVKQTIVNVFFAGVLLSFLLLGTSRWRRLVNASWLKFLGYISYGLYLFHVAFFNLYDNLGEKFWPSLLPKNYRFDRVVLRFAVAAAIAVVVAYLSRKYFEEKFLVRRESLESAAARESAHTSATVSSRASQLVS